MLQWNSGRCLPPLVATLPRRVGGDYAQSRPISTREQPLLVTMNCLNGYFRFPYFEIPAHTVGSTILQSRSSDSLLDAPRVAVVTSYWKSASDPTTRVYTIR